MPYDQNKSQMMYPIFLLAVVLTLSLVFVKSPQNLRLPWFKASRNEAVFTPQPPKSPQKAKIPVLLYHYVEIVTNKDDFLRAGLAVTPSAFEKQLTELKGAGYSFYFVRDIGDLLSTDSTNTKPVIITFDDGYGDFYTDAYPILKRQNVKATVFINSGLMGLLNYMTRDHVKEVAQSGLVEIGGHGFSHQNLVSIDLESAKKVVDDDVSTIKESYK